MTSKQNRLTGKVGENRASEYLEANGYEILERNFRHKRAEIDLIVLWQNELLIFVEVKTRNNSNYGEPETFVTENQMLQIQSAADAYIHDINWEKDIRFDIVTINRKGEINHIHDAFY
jgi:putative endonuclease